MSVAGDAPTDPRFEHLDASGTIELCSSLADYGEAGGLSRDLMMQVGRYAEARYGDDIEVLLALARMYLLGGEALRARAALVRAGKLGPDEGRVTPLLTQVLATLGDPRAADQVLREAPSWPPFHETPAPRAAAVRPTAQSTPPSRAERPAQSQKRSHTPTTPMTRMPGYGPGRPTTPLARQTHPTPAQRRPGEPAQPISSPPIRSNRTYPPGPVSQRPVHDGSAAPRPSVTPGQAVQVRTEVSRRAISKDAQDAGPIPIDDEASAPVSQRPVSGPSILPTYQRPAPIRILDPDDERRKLDPYELIGEIASGGMATVYLGRLAGHGGFSRFVAIKQLHPHLAREEQFVQMFLDEARLAAGIHNPHVVPILEVGMSKAGYFLVMEFIEGDTLAGLTARLLSGGGTLPAPIALRIMVDALTGLHAAHQLTDGDGQPLGLVHRDCTPQNILVGADGAARITDFGVARAASRLAITRPQQVKGKVAYLSPEQAHAMDLDRRSDLFTMGIVLWEALAGRPLFQAENEGVTLSRLLSGPIPSIRSFVPATPAALDDVCRRALYRDRNRRFRTAAEMAEALERAAEVEGLPGVASPRDLGKFVEGILGAELAAQREAVRAGLLASSAGPRVSNAYPSRPPPGPHGYEVKAPPAIVPSFAASPSAEEAPPIVVAPLPQPEAESARDARNEAVAEKASHDGTSLSDSRSKPRAPVEPSPAATAIAQPPTPAEVDVTSEASPAAHAPAPTPAPPARAARASLEALLTRVAAGNKMSLGRGLALAVLLLIIATSPVWLKAINRTHRGSPVTSEK